MWVDCWVLTSRFLKSLNFLCCFIWLLYGPQNHMLACPSGRSGYNSNFWEMFMSVTLRALFVFLSVYSSGKDLNAISSVFLLCTYVASIGFYFLWYKPDFLLIGYNVEEKLLTVCLCCYFVIVSNNLLWNKQRWIVVFSLCISKPI